MLMLMLTLRADGDAGSTVEMLQIFMTREDRFWMRTSSHRMLSRLVRLVRC